LLNTEHCAAGLDNSSPAFAGQFITVTGGFMQLYDKHNDAVSGITVPSSNGIPVK
jgi:hypothetical protein